MSETSCVYNAGIICSLSENASCATCGWNPDVAIKRKESEREMQRKHEFGKILFKLDAGAVLPKRQHKQDAGLDLYSPVEAEVSAGGSCVIDTGVHVELPVGCCGMIVSKSGLNIKHDIISGGLIDCGYTGSIAVKLYNHGTQSYRISQGDKISQLVIVRYVDWQPVEVSEIAGGERGENGFGSTGR